MITLLLLHPGHIDDPVTLVQFVGTYGFIGGLWLTAIALKVAEWWGARKKGGTL